MTPEALAREIEDLIKSAEEIYSGRLVTIQNKLFNDLLVHYRQLDVDDDGFIRQTAENRRIVNASHDTFHKSLKESGYQTALEKHLVVVNKINALNAAYFSGISDTFSPTRNFIKALQGELISNMNTFILSDGLQANVILPLNQILAQNINTGGSFAGFIEQLKTYVTGNTNVQGKLLSYARVYVSDALFNYSRSYQQAVTADLGLEFYLYSGGLIDKSREFCQERSGNFYHHKEIKQWANLSWQGKNKLTTESSIFILAGGYKCGHSIIPVHASIVPDDVIQRNVQNGNYKT